MDDEKLSREIQNELDEITRRKGHLLQNKVPQDKVSLEIIEEFIQCNNNKMEIRKNLMSLLVLISNHLINDSINHVLRELKLKSDEALILQLYMYMQMSSNFIDGFLLGHSFVKVIRGVSVLDCPDPNALEIFKQIYLIRIKQNESDLVEAVDGETNIISHFEKAYKELFLTNSILLNELSRGKAQLVVRHLMMTFFDGILTARIIFNSMQPEEQDNGEEA